MAEILKESSIGILWWNGGNELIQDSKIPDASKFRVGAPFQLGESGGGGAISFDVLPSGAGPGQSRKEIALINSGQMNDGGGEINISVLRPGGASADADMVKVAELRAGEVEFKVPIKAPNLAAGSSHLASPSGRYHAVLQDDGNFVVYDSQPGFWRAVWSWVTGKLT